MLCHSCVLGGLLQNGTETNVAHKRAEVLRHPCVLGGRQTRGQSQRWPKSGRKCYVTPKLLEVPKRGSKVADTGLLKKNPIVKLLKGSPCQIKKTLVLKDHPTSAG